MKENKIKPINLINSQYSNKKQISTKFSRMDTIITEKTHDISRRGSINNQNNSKSDFQNNSVSSQKNNVNNIIFDEDEEIFSGAAISFAIEEPPSKIVEKYESSRKRQIVQKLKIMKIKCQTYRYLFCSLISKL